MREETRQWEHLWRWLERLTQLAVPALLAWGIWVTNKLYAHEQAMIRQGDSQAWSEKAQLEALTRLRLEVLHELNGKLDSINQELVRLRTLVERQK